MQVGGWLLERSPESLPQKGKGFNYGVNIARDIYLFDQHALTGYVNVDGKTYWNHHDYDDLIIRSGFGYKWSSARSSASIVPFYQWRRFGNKPYAETKGVRFEGSYRVTPRWQAASAIEYGNSQYKERDFLDGRYLFSSLTAYYAVNPKTTIFFGIDELRDKTNAAEESSLRVGGRFGIVQDLPLNISTQLRFSYARRLFDDAPNLFGIRRDDREYGATLTLWNRRWSWRRLVPKLNFDCQRTHSNIGLYSFDKNRVYLTLDQKF